MENVLLAVSGCVIVAGLLGLLAAILTSLNERRREMAILRSVGARPAHVFFLLLSEAAIVAGAGAIVGVAVQFALVAAAREAIETRLGILVELRPPGGFEGLVVIVVMVAAVLLALWPAWRAYRNTLADGLAVRV
ncbi:MAG: FtsX-like permease family protein [Pseudomonadota bacterium]